MSWGVEDENRRKGIRELMDISEKLMRENPNHVNEVSKSPSGCWMEQVYGMQRCECCDLASDCPVREEQEWQAFLKANNMVVEKKSS